MELKGFVRSGFLLFGSRKKENVTLYLTSEQHQHVPADCPVAISLNDYSKSYYSTCVRTATATATTKKKKEEGEEGKRRKNTNMRTIANLSFFLYHPTNFYYHSGILLMKYSYYLLTECVYPTRATLWHYCVPFCEYLPIAYRALSNFLP